MRYVAAGSTVDLLFTTNSAAGAAVAPSTAFEAADIILYKDGSATQRSSTAGWTMTSPFDSITGLHCLSIDLSDNTDAGFYVAGSHYTAVLSPDTETVDSQAVVSVIGEFVIGPVAASIAAGAIASGAIDATAIAANAIGASELAADAATEIVTALLAAALDETAVGATVGAALNAARVQGFGKWTWVGTTLTLYASNGTTVVKTFTLDSSTNPTSRT